MKPLFILLLIVLFLPTFVFGATFTWTPSTDIATSYTLYIDGLSTIVKDNIPVTTSKIVVDDPKDGMPHTYYIVANFDEDGKDRISSDPSDFVVWLPPKSVVKGVLKFELSLE